MTAPGECKTTFFGFLVKEKEITKLKEWKNKLLVTVFTAFAYTLEWRIKKLYSSGSCP